jgi:hypothetical protein
MILDEMPKRPLWEFKFDQLKGCIRPRAGLDQTTDLTFCCASDRIDASARNRHHIGHEFGCDCFGTAKLRFQTGKGIISFGIV